jgi:hypothetical protein
MAQNLNDHARDYGLSRNVVADIEADEGPPMQGHHGENRTRVPEHADRRDHGPKTRRKIKEVINNQDEEGT